MGRDEEALHGLLRGLPIIFKDQRHERRAQQLLLGAAENPAVGRADVLEPALDIDLDHQVGLMLDEKTVFALPLRRRPPRPRQLVGHGPDRAVKATVPDHGSDQRERKAHKPEKE